MPQTAIEHQRAEFGLLRSIRNNWHSAFAQARSRPGLAIRRASQASAARTALGATPPVSNSHLNPCGVTRGRNATPLRNPSSAVGDSAQLARPGNDQIQLKLFLDYATNAPMYPALHDCLRTSRVPVLAVWGQNDPIFGPDGARAFGKDAADAEIHLIDGGHFLLETHVAEVAERIDAFLARVNR